MSGPIITRQGPGSFAKADYYEAGPEVHVFSWCPTSDGTGEPTQVHAHFGTPPGTVLAIRFKSPRTPDAVIDALLEHRERVFGLRVSSDEERRRLRLEGLEEKGKAADQLATAARDLVEELDCCWEAETPAPQETCLCAHCKPARAVLAAIKATTGEDPPNATVLR